MVRENTEQTEITEQTEKESKTILNLPFVPLFPFVPYSPLPLFEIHSLVLRFSLPLPLATKSRGHTREISYPRTRETSWVTRHTTWLQH